MDVLDFAATTILKASGSLSNFFRSASKDSLTTFTAVARAEPVCVVESSLVSLPYISDVMHTATTLVAVYYAQAFALTNEIGGINLVKRLDRLNPTRSVTDSVLNQPYVSTEELNHRLPSYLNSRNISTEAPESSARTGRSVGFGRDTPAQLQNASNLAVGKIIEVTATDGACSASIPVTITLHPLMMEREIALSTFSNKGFQNQRKGRLYRWRAGELETINDMIFCRDLIDQHRRALVKDNTGFYAAVRDKRRNNRLAALASGDPSLGTISSIAVLSSSTARELAVQLGAPLSDYQTRQNVFNDTSLLMMFVIDQDRNMVQVYYHGIKAASLFSISDLKQVGKGNSTDLTEILRAFQQVSAPAF
jgi:hypothetical protein